METVLITGGCGFIGSNLVWQRAFTGYKLVILDKLTYAGRFDNISSIVGPMVVFEEGDIRDYGHDVYGVFDKHRPTYVIHLAAESHVDRSINDPHVFLDTNVLGTQVLLECARQYGVKKFVQVSTDEVYGSLDLGGRDKFHEGDSLAPSSPYSASKAAADLLALAYHKTYGLPVVVTRCSNNYGPIQHEEKFIPKCITTALADEPIELYGPGNQVRDWIHVSDHCRGLWMAMLKGIPGEVYHFGGDNERTNLEVAQWILGILDKPIHKVKFVADRKGHDVRYAVDFAWTFDRLGWSPMLTFKNSLEDVVSWYVNQYVNRRHA